jgi:hypothetical protein
MEFRAQKHHSDLMFPQTTGARMKLSKCMAGTRGGRGASHRARLLECIVSTTPANQPRYTGQVLEMQRLRLAILLLLVQDGL